MLTTSSFSERGDTELENHNVVIRKIRSPCKIDSMKKGKLMGV